MEKFKIEKRVSIPKTLDKNRWKFISEMNIGDSFVTMNHNDISSAHSYARQHGLKICSRTTEKDKYRIWRIK